ncbi:MAG: hypothetical protein JSW51_09610 [Gemmatimonadota bacterium]|nr:MAG: hypothetical protein JSW51_09610 [Gemmatimonadota bacterium]
MQLTIGSNRLCNTDGVISIRGKRQIALEWGPCDTDLWLTMDLYAAEGRHVARLWRNEWTFNDYGRFEFKASARGFSLVDTKSRQVVLEARVVGMDSVVITQGAFYSSAGHEIEITTEDWKDAADSRESAELAARSSHLPFDKHEIASIREAVASSGDSVDCPQCGCPLIRQNVANAQHRDTVLVSCIICRRNLVVHSLP